MIRLFCRNFMRGFGQVSGWCAAIAGWVWAWRLLGIIPFHLIDGVPK